MNGANVAPRSRPPPPVQWYAEAEKTNARWAMAAVAGILFTEVLGKPAWFEVRASAGACAGSSTGGGEQGGAGLCVCRER